MSRFKKIMVVMAQVLFIGFFLALYAVVYMGPGGYPNQKWFSKFPTWFLIVMNLIALIITAAIIWLIVQIIMNG